MARNSTNKAPVEDSASNTYNMAGTKEGNELPSVMESDVDVDDAPPPEPLPKGEYPAEVNAAEVKVSQKGNSYVDVTLFVAPEAYPADYEQGNPQGLNLHYRRLDASTNPVTGKLTPRAAYNIGKFMRTIGLRGGRSIDVNEWVGQPCRVRIDHEASQNDADLMLPVVVAVLPA